MNQLELNHRATTYLTDLRQQASTHRALEAAASAPAPASVARSAGLTVRAARVAVAVMLALGLTATADARTSRTARRAQLTIQELAAPTRNRPELSERNISATTTLPAERQAGLAAAASAPGAWSGAFRPYLSEY